MMQNATKQTFMVRAIAWYLRDCPLQRGKGLVNRLLGRFLRVKVIQGIKIRILNPLEHLQAELLNSTVYEPEMTELLRTVLQPGMVVFDVGANLGYYTLLASLNVGFQGQVHAFEPSREQFEHLKLNIRLNDAANVFPNNCAVADTGATREFFLAGGWNSGTHSLAKTMDQTEVCKVACTTIDDYVHDNKIARIDLMKIDIEGGELLLLRGASRTLATLPPGVILFESCEKHAQAFGNSTSDVKRLLCEQGYTIHRFDLANGLCDVSPSEKETFANLLAIHGAHREMHQRIADALRGASAKK